MPKCGLQVRLEAKPGSERDVEKLLTAAEELVRREPGTKSWFATKTGPYTFGIFDTFDDEAGRQAHLTGKAAAALMANTSLFAKLPTIERVNLIGEK